MSEAATPYIIGINWGSTNFRAFRIGHDGQVTGAIEQPRSRSRSDGVTSW